MNRENVRKVCTQYFQEKNIKLRDIFQFNEYTGKCMIKNTFIPQVKSMIEETNFYNRCLMIMNSDRVNQPERVKFIIQEIRKSDTPYDENDLEDCDFIYNWYFENRIEYYLNNDIHFFFEVLQS